MTVYLAMHMIVVMHAYIFLSLGFFGVLGSPAPILSVVLYIAPVGCMADSCMSWWCGADNSSMLFLQCCLLFCLAEGFCRIHALSLVPCAMELPQSDGDALLLLSHGVCGQLDGGHGAEEPW